MVWGLGSLILSRNAAMLVWGLRVEGIEALKVGFCFAVGVIDERLGNLRGFR